MFKKGPRFEKTLDLSYLYVIKIRYMNRCNK